MSKKRVRCITSGILPLALWGLTACNGVAGPSTAPTLIFSASVNSINAGQSVTLNWQTTNATSVTITATAGSATRTVTSTSQASGSVNDSPAQTTTYSAVATGAHGSTTPQTATVQVAQPVPPQVTSFTASPMFVSAGQPSTIAWTTTNATSVTISPAVAQTEDTGPLPTTGSSLTPVTSTTTFTITASGPGGTSAPATVTVTVPFNLSLTASPSTITPGTPATLAWQVTGGTATSISVTDAAGNSVCSGTCALPQGSATVNPGTTTTYTATAAVNPSASITQSATVTVNAASVGVVKHIFFMLQENRSFDMYLGQLGAYRLNRLNGVGITDTQTVDGFDPNVTLTNSNTGAKVQPFHEATVCTENLTPPWDESHHDTSLTGGDAAWATTTSPYSPSSFAMQGFLDTTDSVPENYDPNGTRALGYYNETDLPYYYDLATFFATSDAWHSPILANTVPNRMYLMAGTSFGHEYPDGDANHPKYAAPTIFRAMNTANVSWLYYYTDGIFLANFADFADPAIGPKTFPVSDLMNRLGGCNGSCDPDKALPEVIFIDSASGASHLDEHPDNNVQSGAAYVQSIIAALMQSDAWNDSVFILSYDEGGGLYDHVPPVNVPPPDDILPGQCPDPNNGSSGYCTVGKLGGTFDLTGFRVPVIVISPYAKPNYVSHTPRDYTAILAFIESTFGVQALTKRDAYWTSSACTSQGAGCSDMSEFFDFSNPALLHPPASSGFTSWPQLLRPQTASGVCNPQLETPQ